MLASHRSCVLIAVILAVSGIPGCDAVPFWLEPKIECPASMNVGQEATLVIRRSDDGIMWRQQSEDNAAGVFVEEWGEGAEFRSGNDVDTTTARIVFRAERAGIITITAEEFISGAIFLPIPYRLSTVQCTFTIVDE